MIFSVTICESYVTHISFEKCRDGDSADLNSEAISENWTHLGIRFGILLEALDRPVNPARLLEKSRREFRHVCFVPAAGYSRGSRQT